jgi:hypothetical protein
MPEDIVSGANTLYNTKIPAILIPQIFKLLLDFIIMVMGLIQPNQ